MKKVEEIHGKRKFRNKTYKKRKTYKRKTYKKRKTYRKKRKLINKSYRRRYIGGSRRHTPRTPQQCARARNFLKSSIDSHFKNKEVRKKLKDPELFTIVELQNIVNLLSPEVTKHIESLIIGESPAVQKAVLQLLAVVAPNLRYLHHTAYPGGTGRIPKNDDIEWFKSCDLGNILRQIILYGLEEKDQADVENLLNPLEMEDLKQFAILYTYEPEPVEKLTEENKQYLSEMIIDEMFSPEPEPESVIDETDESWQVKEDTDQVIKKALLMMKPDKPHKEITEYLLGNNISSKDIFDRVKSKPDDQYTDDELLLLGLLEFLPSPE